MGSTIVCFCNISPNKNPFNPHNSRLLSLSTDSSFNPSLSKPIQKTAAIKILSPKLNHKTFYKPDDNPALIYSTSKHPIYLNDLIIAKFMGFGIESKMLLVLNKTFNKPEYRFYCLKVIKKTEDMRFEGYKVIKSPGNPFLARIKGMYEGHNNIYFLREYVSGGKLLELLKKDKLYNEMLIAFIMAEILLALEHLHKVIGIPYGNLKASNIHLSAKGHIALTDYGIYSMKPTKIPESDLYYIAPEILSGQNPIDTLSDLYSFGAILAEIMNELLMNTTGFTKDLIEKLMGDRSMRGSIEDIKTHGFFKKVNWDMVKGMKLQSPFVVNGKRKTGSENNEKKETSLGEAMIISSVVHFMK